MTCSQVDIQPHPAAGDSAPRCFVKTGNIVTVKNEGRHSNGELTAGHSARQPCCPRTLP